ncbi:hypothetical protein SUGI_0911010 [Cryptomeria japonica]|uniref:3-ketoacyl-CoA synthase 1-like n=1 Tax=Cryptomeria japonica TaxID=3369 RepID=UPI002414A7CF|nr:3-ketoacyl-CoA synthase 1-like [Cryptomeria japonica]GLJ43760.1 hypothetical protein SUGI_0911010 [Cryptomeria japonica]
MKRWVGFVCMLLLLLRNSSVLSQLCVATALGWLLLQLLAKQSRRECFLVDFTCYKPPAERQANAELSIYVSFSTEPIIPENLKFQWKIFLSSGLGEETSLPRFIFKEEMVATLEEARVEMEETFFATAADLFARTGVTPQDIDILIVTVSTFTAAPSHASVVANHYKMKENVKTFNLSGMGCSAGVLAVNMAKDLLLVNPDSYALILSTENTTVNANYPGKDRSFMLTNSLFRAGGAALLLSNKPQDAARAKLRLLHSIRTNVAAANEAYGCISVTEDDEGVYGVRLRSSLHTIAAKALTTNLAKLGPKVLPLREQLYYAYNWLCINLLKMKVEAYVPNFKLAFQHFCVHPGGRGVISGIGKSLKLNEYDLEASRMALFRFGNTSASGVWYEMAYLYAKGRLKVGERVLQIALGSGFKCNTAVWEVVREKHPLESSCWDECLNRYPCDTKKNYTDDFCDQWLSPVTPSIQPTSNDLDTNTT